MSGKPAGRGRFDVWAPIPERVRLRIGTDQDAFVVTMQRGEDAWWTPTASFTDPGGDVDYGYLLDADGSEAGDDLVPDPRSLRQPSGVHAASRTYDPDAFAWTDQAWTGRQLAGSVVYELHVGTFTPEGTFDAALERLDHLRSIGVELVEVMPLNGVNGTHNWGYDGVLWSTVTETYGGPEAYQRFVDGCHAAGLGVVQDVVYNHLGPSGNYLPLFGPYLATEGANTWGSSVNLDGEGSPEVRRLIIDNALMWLRDYHVDGLRLDAVHALVDTSPVHLLEQLAIETAALSAYVGRPLSLIAESDLNDTHLVTPREGGGYGLDAQWSDDFHHAAHVALTGETSGYYADFEPLAALAKVCTRGFFHDGTHSSFRKADHGKPVDVDRMPLWRLVVCTQNHDQIGNRARGDRNGEVLDEGQLAIGAMLTLAGPFTPMLFMGEEWAASTPFQFFTSHPEPELGKATAEGRIKEFEEMGWDPDQVPDPQDPETFQRSKLDWSEPEGGRHAVVLDAYRRLAALRRSVPALTDPSFTHLTATSDEDTRLFWLTRSPLGPGDDDSEHGTVEMIVNFGAEKTLTVPLGHLDPDNPDGGPRLLLFATDPALTLPPEADTLTLPPHTGVLLLTP